MGWPSAGYHYTKEELKPAEVRAGCCDGWYWVHKRPNMFIQGYILKKNRRRYTMTIHNFGPIYHSESPTSMKMTGWVDNDGNYSITFESAFDSEESVFNDSWIIYVGEDETNPVMEIPENTIGNNADFTQTCTGKIDGTHFYAWAHCGSDGCTDNTSPLVIADIDLLIPSLGTIEVTEVTTKSITVKATWTNGINKESNVKFELYDASDNLLLEDTSYDSDGSDPITFDNLTHNSEYIIKASISDETITLNYEDINISTKCLGLKYSDLEVHQYSIAAKFISTIDDNENYSQTNITRSKFELLDESNNIIDNSNVSYEDDAPATSIVTVSDLTSYTEYNLVYYITDGFNEVSLAINATTVFPYIRINVDGECKKAISYIYTNDEWHMTKGFVGQLELNGE